MRHIPLRRNVVAMAAQRINKDVAPPLSWLSGAATLIPRDTQTTHSTITGVAGRVGHGVDDACVNDQTSVQR